ncbi:hypothetical protein [Heliophilum fasciatum]|uniref:Uncharacterized protein n=1 Tax=Heliophilum fasciatum TaxID=35700 RepID=A0A4R2RN59_9FIRM|nr:hypothetical protein [Heliophilum fasciatum]MCW2279234.1 hypothetical protein [Heliophilum fasciatum]TCP60635.1 hypothetical protein EDD73_13523 [Heliophilum fasciatum]
MIAQQVWNIILTNLKDKRTELPTAPKTKKSPLWFSVTLDGNAIIVDNAAEHKPSCKIAKPRRLTYEEFQKVYPLYLRRENGEKVSAEVISVTFNQVYYFSLIKHLGQEKSTAFPQ